MHSKLNASMIFYNELIGVSFGANLYILFPPSCLATSEIWFRMNCILYVINNLITEYVENKK